MTCRENDKEKGMVVVGVGGLWRITVGGGGDTGEPDEITGWID